jgi:hypothetical protein
VVTERSLEAQKRGYLERLRLNKALSKNLYWRLPFDDEGHENFVPVGRGGRSSELCSRWLSHLICRRTDLHKDIVINGLNYTGKVVVRHRHLWCNRSSCCVCFVRGWSTREARSIEGRIYEGVERGFGKPEHIFVSVPLVDYGLSEDVLRERCRKALLDRGVIGGCMIFHGYRPDRVNKILVWSPHYHTLGFIRGGFDVCRKCYKRGVRRCDDCGEFKGRETRGYAKDKYFVSCIEDERKSVFSTACYQLNHATLRVGVKRFQVVTWFGLLGCSKMKALKVKPEVLCPACHYGMEKAFHVGKKRVSKDVSEEDYASLFLDDEFDDAGDPNYIACGGGRFG